MFAHRHELQLDSPDATCQFARSIAPCLTGGDAMLLAGGVGAGKTHFARCLIQSLLTIPEDVPSPTYTLIQTYDTSKGEIWHADLYRLNDTSEIEELGLAQAFAESICLVEWPDRLGNEAPQNALWITFDAPDGDDKRIATMEWDAARWTTIMREVLDD